MARASRGPPGMTPADGSFMSSVEPSLAAPGTGAVESHPVRLVGLGIGTPLTESGCTCGGRRGYRL